MQNQDVINALQKYVPTGYLQYATHIPEAGCGDWYRDVEGRKYLDWRSGIFTNSFGHNGISMSISANSLSNIHGRHSKEELKFLQKLFRHLPASDYKAVVYGDGGGYTVDRGLTVLHQHFGKRMDIRIAAYAGGFHGKTQATKLLINETERATFFQNEQLSFPNCYRCPWGKNPLCCTRDCIEETCQQLEEKKIDVLVFEPVQGAGIVLPPEGYWRAVAEFCRDRGILLFADEVLTGGGRTGSYLACAAFGVVPDIIVLTKGLANGLPLSALLIRDHIVQNPYSTRCSEFSSTFLAVPFLLEVGCRVLDAIEEQDILNSVCHLGTVLRDGLLKLKERFACIGDVRSIGLMAAVEFVSNRETKTPAFQLGKQVFLQCEKNGLETIFSGHILRIAPALNTTEEQIRQGLLLLERGIQEAVEGSE